MNAELLLPAAFAAGFFGSTHCIGMCGAVVVLLEGQGAGMPRRLLCNLGRGLFYVLLGVVAGVTGQLLTGGLEAGLMLLRYLSAVLIVALGVNLLFELQALRFLERAGATLWQRLSPFARHVLPITTPVRALSAGFIWGPLPCGLVYSAVAIAATSGSGVSGGLVMAAFWAGTLPALVAAGASAATLARLRHGRNMRRAAGVVLIVIGAVALVLPMRHAPAEDGHHATPTRRTGAFNRS